MLTIEQLSTDKKLLIGSRWEVKQVVADYNPAFYKLQYTFTRKNESKISFYTSASGDAHLLVINSKDTLMFNNGYYSLSIYAVSLVNEDLIYPIAVTAVNVIGDQDFCLDMLTKIEKALLQLADKTMGTVSVDGKTYAYKDIGELERLAEYYRDKAGIKSKRAKRILLRFE